MTKLRTGLLAFIGITTMLCGINSCARMGSPQGGHFDVNPPRFITSSPQANAVNFTEKKIELFFDELINIEKPMEKIIITPPQKRLPDIKALGRKIQVELKDSLLPNTTYTFDFTNGIVDNNEKNVLEGFSFAFSTGSVVDSLVISGLLLQAENLEPTPNIMIGLHQQLDDSAFTSIPFVRTTRTNDEGRFWVRNVAPGTYRIFALNDLNRDYHFDQKGEDIAFLDSIIVPSFEPAMRRDTLWKDSVTVDTIKNISYNRFLPDNIHLLLFKEKFERQYLSKTERTQAYTLTFQFNSEPQPPPKFRFLNVKTDDDWAIPEYSNEGKIITYWIQDSLVYQQDTIHLEAEYLASDSLNKLIPVKDTLSLVVKNKPKPREEKGKKEKDKIDFLGVSISSQSVVEVFDTLKFTFSEPIIQLDTSSIRIEQKVDTLWQVQRIPLVKDSLNPRMYSIYPLWPYGKEYRISIDSAAIRSIYGKWNDKLTASFKIPEESTYGNLYILLNGTSGRGFGELLDGSDKSIRKSLLIDGELVFENVKPGKYYIRYIEDKNENGHWDPGDYKLKRQAEEVFYYPASLELKPFFNIEQNWDVKSVPIEKQKLLDITKNKPEQKKQPKKNENRKSNKATIKATNDNTSNSTGSFM